MKGHNTFANMTPEKYAEACENVRLAKLGSKNPMYGKNAEDFMTEEAVIQKREKMRQNQLGTCRMINLTADNPKVVNVKLDEVDEYLKMGYEFFRCHFIPKNQIPNKYAYFHNTYWIEVSKPIGEYLNKMFECLIVPNDLAYSFLRCHSNELQLNDNGIHYNRKLLNCDLEQPTMMILSFKSKNTLKDILKCLGCNDQFKIELFDHSPESAMSFIDKLNEKHEHFKITEMLTDWKKKLVKSIIILSKFSTSDQQKMHIVLSYLDLAKRLNKTMRYIRTHIFKLRFHSHATKAFLTSNLYDNEIVSSEKETRSLI